MVRNPPWLRITWAGAGQPGSNKPPNRASNKPPSFHTGCDIQSVCVMPAACRTASHFITRPTSLSVWRSSVGHTNRAGLMLEPSVQGGEARDRYQGPSVWCSRIATARTMATMINQPSGVARSDRIAWPRLFVRPFARLWRRPREGQRIDQHTDHRWWVAAALPFEPQPLPCRGG